MEGINIVDKYLASSYCGLCFYEEGSYKIKNGKFECNQMKNTNQPIMTKAFYLLQEKMKKFNEI